MTKTNIKATIEDVMTSSNEKLKEILGRTKEYTQEEEIKLRAELLNHHMELFERAFPEAMAEDSTSNDEKKYPGINKVQRHFIANDEVLSDELEEGIERVNECKSDTLEIVVNKHQANVVVLGYRGSWFPEHGVEVFFFGTTYEAASFMIRNINSNNFVGFRMVEPNA